MQCGIDTKLNNILHNNQASFSCFKILITIIRVISKVNVNFEHSSFQYKDKNPSALASFILDLQTRYKLCHHIISNFNLLQIIVNNVLWARHVCIQFKYVPNPILFVLSPAMDADLIRLALKIPKISTHTEISILDIESDMKMCHP